MDGKEAIYKRYLEALRLKLIAKYDELGLRASGKYADQLEGVTAPLKMIVMGAVHSGVMETGRAPGKFPPYNPQTGTFDEISEWIETKQGLPAIFKEKKKQFTFLIARKIATEGIKVPGTHNAGKVISEVVESFLGEDVDAMLKELGQYYFTRIRTDLLIIFNQLTP